MKLSLARWLFLSLSSPFGSSAMMIFTQPLKHWQVAAISAAVLSVVDPTIALAFGASFLMFHAPERQSLTRGS